ncbi:MAG TPA: hypothetical protein VLG15_14205 [Thermoanaerobaculia bacterium]|nr:hypothetical protein [Thermoanaerobaculia bacterium]
MVSAPWSLKTGRLHGNHVQSVSLADARKGARGGGGRQHPGLLKHLSKDDLVLYQYGEIRTAPAEGHLSVCRGCRDRLSAMRLDVERLVSPPAGHGRRSAPPASPPPAPPRLSVWRHLREALFRVVPGRRSPPRTS